jgi:hypothetical protein
MASIIKADTLQSTTSNVFVLNSAGTEYARFNSSGNLGIGTTTQIGAEKIGISFDDSVFNGLGIQVQGSSSSAGYTIFRNSSGTSIGTITRNGTASSVKYNTTSSSATGAYLLDSGVAFPATQVSSADANTLDDYEEGTWTPVIIGSSTAGTGTYSVQNGRYTKIGNRVYFGVYCIWSAHTGTGDMTMGGLPFTSSGSNFTGVSIRYSNLTCSAGYICTPIVADNRSDIVFQQSAVGAAATALGQSLDVSADVIMAGHYFIA